MEIINSRVLAPPFVPIKKKITEPIYTLWETVVCNRKFPWQPIFIRVPWEQTRRAESHCEMWRPEKLSWDAWRESFWSICFKYSDFTDASLYFGWFCWFRIIIMRILTNSCLQMVNMKTWIGDGECLVDKDLCAEFPCWESFERSIDGPIYWDINWNCFWTSSKPFWNHNECQSEDTTSRRWV